jgi:molecular chaperone DnaK (HSP70)
MPSGAVSASHPPTGRYLVGIDLGTTNSALACVDLHQRVRDRKPAIRPVPVPQLVSPGTVADRLLLPSFLYLPSEHDLPPGATALPWDAAAIRVVGEFARAQGAKVPGRLVTSAKSWLCHAGVDRTAPLLPFGAPPDVPRISPVEASTAYLKHLVDAWNHVVAKGKPEDALQKQTVVLTVPASFDDVARTLTVEAAKRAGLENLTLLEEPQAAFYCWLATHPPQEAEALKPGQRCLVVDVGGGTSDFSLIECIEEQGQIGFVRRAVGNHLLLGGDNMDLALAKVIENKLLASGGRESPVGSPSRLDAVQYSLLTQSCRQAKEALLAPKPPATHSVTVMGRGRSVIGGSMHANLTPADVRQVIFEGFFPKTARDALPMRGARAGLHEMGLPYVSDPAVTRHLAEFLQRHAGGTEGTPVDAILFNGGVFQSAALRDHLLDVLHHWYDRPKHPWQPLVLTNPSLDLAVALGSAYYAWLRHTGGRRIGGGIARSYYLGVGGGEGHPSSDGLTVLCVVPRRLEEGQEIRLEKPELELALGQPVTFPLYTSTVRADEKAGDVLSVKPDQLLRLPPLHTILRGGKRAGVKSVPVTLAARSTEIGTLELFCVAKEGDNRWRLEFNVRELVQDDEPGEESSSEGQLTDVWPEDKVQEAARLIRGVYDGRLDLRPQELINALEPALEARRDEWPTGLCRRLWEILMELTDQRRRSPAHLNRWYNLIGFCLRPGFGDSLDRFRIEKLWKLLYSPARQDAGGRATPEGGAQQWIMWRRVAGGLQTSYQQSLFDRGKGALLGGKGSIKPGADELAEMWRMAASLERLDIKQKELLGQALLKQVRRSPAPTYAFWSLTRLGARSLLYGPLNTVLHHQTVETWLDALLSFKPGHQSETTAWAFCLSQLARRTGQRALDVDDSHRKSVITLLKTLEVPEDWAREVEEVLERRAEEQSQLFGDSLPIGLRLVPS